LPLSVNDRLVPFPVVDTTVPSVSLPASLELAYRFRVTVAPLSHVTVPETLFAVCPEIVTPGAAGATATVIVYDAGVPAPLLADTVNTYVPDAAGVNVNAPLLLLMLYVPDAVPVPAVAPPLVHVALYSIVALPLAVREYVYAPPPIVAVSLTFPPVNDAGVFTVKYAGDEKLFPPSTSAQAPDT
jgi:hypothetical protein